MATKIGYAGLFGHKRHHGADDVATDAHGMVTTALSLVIGSAAALLLLSGPLFGSTVPRTVFIPSFTSGVAIFLLWQKFIIRTTAR